MKFHAPTKIIFIVLFILLILGIVVLTIQYPKLKKSAPSSNEISITSPTAGQVISSPVHVVGKAKGSWFFEATFPISILDANGKVLGIGHAQAQGDWQTTDFVNFTADINFNLPSGTKGNIEFSNDNPSGLPQNQKTLDLPITFSTTVSKNPPGTCSPNLVACAGDPKICADENVNAVCN